MTAIIPRPVSDLRLVLTYLAFLVGGIVLLNLVFLVVQTFFQFSMANSSAMGILLMIAAGGSVGQTWYKHEQVTPSGGRAWRVAFLCLLATLAIQALIVAALYLGATAWGQNPLSGMRSSDMPILAGVAGGIVILELLVIRAGMFMGGRDAKKKAERLAAKAV